MVRRSLSIYQLRVELDEISPAIWRRLHVPADISFGKLHYVLQDAFGWQNSHLHHFLIGDRRIGMTDIDEFDDSLEDEAAVKLSSVAKKSSRLVYEYDFGDSWNHLVLVEEVIAADTPLKHALCVDGARACPPEDCGGSYGYADLLKALKRPTKKNAELRQWLGDGFEPERFDLKSTNAAIRSNLTRRLSAQY